MHINENITNERENAGTVSGVIITDSNSTTVLNLAHINAKKQFFYSTVYNGNNLV